MRISVLLNPNAAAGRTRRLLPSIKRRLAPTGHQFEWITTQSGDEMRAAILHAKRNGADALLLVGGDGTVHQALPAIEACGLPFGLLPCGRGNDFARNINIPLRLADCLQIEAPTASQIDLPSVNGRPFGSIACLGFDATVNRLASDGRGYFGGSLGYVVCVVKALREFRPFEVELRIDGHRWRGRIMMVAVANGPYYGGGMKIAPAARMSDGVLDLCVVKEVSRSALLRSFPKVFRGRHTSHPDVEMMTGTHIAIASDEDRAIFADGELIGRTPAVCTVGDRRIQILRPGPARADLPGTLPVP